MSAQVSRAIKLYADLAPNYDAETRFITGIRRQAIAALRLKPGETVLDAGCGTGWCLPTLAEQVGPQGKVIGFEPSPDMLTIARSRVKRAGLGQVDLQHACGETVALSTSPDAILFSYTHDLIRSRSSLDHIFGQCRPGTRIIAASTKLFPRWFFPGNWYLRHTHRVTITNFDSFDRPWTLLSGYCSMHAVRITIPGSRYLFEGVLD
jgi:demethylmenaquinone methyltransferase/2-methoxy-6-polyprenyl-1,4-benzoquinol methylase